MQKCLRTGMLKEGVRLDRVRGGRQKYRRQSITPIATQAISVQSTSQPMPQQSIATTTAVNNSYYHHHHHLLFNNNYNSKTTSTGNHHQYQQFSHQICSKGNNDTTNFDSQHSNHVLSSNGEFNGSNNNNNDLKTEFPQQCCSTISGVDSVRECGKFYCILYARLNKLLVNLKEQPNFLYVRF